MIGEPCIITEDRKKERCMINPLSLGHNTGRNDDELRLAYSGDLITDIRVGSFLIENQALPIQVTNGVFFIEFSGETYLLKNISTFHVLGNFFEHRAIPGQYTFSYGLCDSCINFQIMKEKIYFCELNNKIILKDKCPTRNYFECMGNSYRSYKLNI